MIDRDLVAQARVASLVEYFRRKGYSLRPVKSRRGLQYKIPDFGGLYVRDHFFYQFSTERSGNAIECLMQVLGLSFPEAVSELLDVPSCVRSDAGSGDLSMHSKPIEMPERSPNVKRVYAYLIQKRGLDPKMVSLLVANKLLYQDIRGNAVFVHFDFQGNAIGGEIQGTTDVRFKGIVAGTHYSCFEISSGKPERVYLFECAIDMMSYIQLRGKDPENRNVLYRSMAGLKKEIVHQHLRDGTPVKSFVDNDPAGKAFNKTVRIEIDYPGIEIITSKDFEFVCGRNDDSYVFCSEEDRRYFKEKLNLKDDVLSKCILLGDHPAFSVDDYLHEAGCKDWNELLLSISRL